MHTGSRLSDDQIRKLAALSNSTHMDELLDNICVVRVVGTPGHARVKKVRIIINPGVIKFCI